MKIKIVTTRNDEEWKVSYVCTPEFEGDVAPRVLRRSKTARAAFPLPPASEDELWEGQPHAELIKASDHAKLHRLFEETMAGESSGEDIETFGKYLSSALLGDLWPRAEADAGAEPVELDLYFEWDDTELHRLPWEIMYGSDRPLCDDENRTVAITRFIIPREKRVIARTPVLPLKVLFVIGMPLDDNLRPGAEYLGLLRRMNVSLKSLEGKVETVDLNLRLLLDATTESLKDAVAGFRPDVVHFICHGSVIAGQSTIYLTKVLEDKSKAADPCDAAHLIEYIRDAKGALPQIVVLNACRTADPSPQSSPRNSSVDEGAYLSFAAQLVAGGVPVAVGMAGEIADGACRIFTRSFYKALVSGESISLAAAKGRRAALLNYSSKITNYLTSIEWARPTLFLAQDVPTSLSVDTECESDMLALTRAATRFRLTETSPSIMCDRFECWKDYHEFCDGVWGGAGRQVLAFGVNEDECPKDAQFGKTRLLEEMAARAVLDGFVPCFIPSTGKEQDPAANLLLFALRLAKAIDYTRESFKLPERTSRAVAQAFKSVLGDAPVPSDPVDFELAKARVVEALGKYDKVPGYSTDVIRNIIIEDLRRLRCDAYLKMRRRRRLRREDARNPPPRPPVVLVMIDDLHRYPPGVTDALLTDLVTHDGLGNRQIKVPMIFTYKFKGSLVNELESSVKYNLRQRQLKFVDISLKPFSGPYEDRLAYSQYFLSANPPLALNWRAEKREAVDYVLTQMREVVEGYPSRFNTADQLQLMRKWFSAPAMQVLLEADDERYLREMSPPQSQSQ